MTTVEAILNETPILRQRSNGVYGSQVILGYTGTREIYLGGSIRRGMAFSIFQTSLATRYVLLA